MANDIIEEQANQGNAKFSVCIFAALYVTALGRREWTVYEYIYYESETVEKIV